MWAAPSHATYKAAMKARLKAQMKARQEAISKMRKPEYKAYRHRLKALKDARKATKEAARDNICAAWRNNPNVGFKEISLVDLIPDYASLTKAAIDERGYKDVGTDDILDYVYKRPDVNLLTAYTKGLEGWADRVVPLQLLEQLMWVLASPAEVLWLGVRRHKLQLMQKLPQQQQQQNGMKVDEE